MKRKFDEKQGVKKIVPRDSIRSIELLVNSYPDKTGKEIKQMHEHDRLCYNAWLQERDKHLIAEVKRLNDVKYFKLKSHISNSKYYIEIEKAYLDNREIIFNGIVTCMMNLSVVKNPEGVHIETLEKKTYQKYDNYFCGIDEVIELSEQDYLGVLNKVNEIFNL